MAVPSYASGQPAAQTLLQRALGQCPTQFSSIANVISGPKVTFKVRDVDTTAHPTAQTSSATVPATWIPTIREYMVAFDISIKTDTDDYAELIALAQNSNPVNWKIVEADSRPTAVLFTGYFTQFDLDHPVAGIVKATCQLRVTGDIEFGF
jgi:hypothetical protein